MTNGSEVTHTYTSNKAIHHNYNKFNSPSCFTFTLLLTQAQILKSSMSLGRAEGPGRGGGILSLHQTSYLELSSSVRRLSSLSSPKSKLKTHLISAAYWSVIFFSLYQPITSNACICSVRACVCVNVCVCHEISISLCVYKHSWLP